MTQRSNWSDMTDDEVNMEADRQLKMNEALDEEMEGDDYKMPEADMLEFFSRFTTNDLLPYLEKYGSYNGRMDRESMLKELMDRQYGRSNKWKEEAAEREANTPARTPEQKRDQMRGLTKGMMEYLNMTPEEQRAEDARIQRSRGLERTRRIKDQDLGPVDPLADPYFADPFADVPMY